MLNVSVLQVTVADVKSQMWTVVGRHVFIEPTLAQPGVERKK